MTQTMPGLFDAPAPERPSVPHADTALAELIRVRMAALGMDGPRFAEHAGVGYGELFALLREGPGLNPALGTVARLAKALERPTHEVVYLLMPGAPGAPG